MEMIRKMIETHPVRTSFGTDELADCIADCFSCAAICTSCADACLNEQQVEELRRCIRLNQDCANVCTATGQVLARQGSVSEEVLRNQLRACMAACDVCGKECRMHRHHEHCLVCADSCIQCKEACGKVLSAMTAEVR